VFFFLKKDFIKRMVRTNALRKGLLGGSPFWRVIWGAQLLLKGWNKVSKSGDAPIEFNEPLEEGQVWALVHEPEQSKRGRGEGRKLVVGPKRKPPRANVMTGTALATVGKKILEAPSAERINEILGVDAVTAPPLSRSQKRQAKRDAKMAAKKAKANAKAAVKSAKVDAKLASKVEKADAKQAVKTARSDAKEAVRTAKSDAKAAAKTAKSDAKAAAKTAKSDAKAAARATAKADRKTTKRADKAPKPEVVEVLEVVQD